MIAHFMKLEDAEDELTRVLARVKAAELFLNGSRADLALEAICEALRTAKIPDSSALFFPEIVQRVVEQIMRQSRGQ